MKKIWKFLLPSFLAIATVATVTPILTSCSFTTTPTPDNSLVNSGNARFQLYKSGIGGYIVFSVFGLPVSKDVSLEWRLNDKVIDSLIFNESNSNIYYRNIVKFQGEGNYSVYLKIYNSSSSTHSTTYYHLSTQYITLADFN